MDLSLRALINLTRRLRSRPRARFVRIIEVAERSHLPDRLRPRSLYVLGAPAKWALFECPCGRGHNIQLNLVHAQRARWLLSVEEGRPTLFPSVDVRGDRRCHFWVRAGSTRWV